MRKQVLIIVSVALTSFLMGTMVSTNYLASGGKPNPIWEAIYDLQSKVSTLNATAIEQQAQISELQTRVDILNATKLGTPDYDSGWVLANQTTVTLNHNLGTTEVFVYLIGKGDNPSYLINQYGYGNYLAWGRLSATQISVDSYLYLIPYIRVLIWKIPS